MSSRFSGECMGGPYANQRMIHEGKTWYVVFQLPNELTGVPFIRHGKYIFDDMNKLWLWFDPVEKAA